MTTFTTRFLRNGTRAIGAGLFSVGLACALGGCGPADAEGPADEPAADLEQGVVAAGTRRALYVSEDPADITCRSPIAATGTGENNAWVGARLFPAVPKSSPLARVCLYNWTLSRNPKKTDYAQLSDTLDRENGVQLLALKPALYHPNLSLHGDVYPPPVLNQVLFNPLPPKTMVEEYRDLFRSRAGRIELTNVSQWTNARLGKLPAEYLASDKKAHSVRIAVIDSAKKHCKKGTIQEALDTCPGGVHGVTVGKIIEDLACPDSSNCLAHVYYHPALFNGGVGAPDDFTIGTNVDLAVAIVEAVNQWRDDFLAVANKCAKVPNRRACVLQHKKFQDRLILNLSLGWDRGPGDDPTNPLAIHAEEALVGLALNYASCHGALVLASAGNAWGNLTNPILPALAQKLSEFPKDKCAPYGVSPAIAALFGHDSPAPGAPTLPTDGYRPYLFSVGGLAQDGRPLPNSRAQALPPFAAYAQSVVLGTNASHTPFFSGTSMATPVVAASAAAIWAFNPDLSAQQVMSLVYDAGKPTEFFANHWPTSRVFIAGRLRNMSWPVVRVSFCEALRKGLSLGQSAPFSCPADAPNVPLKKSWFSAEKTLVGMGYAPDGLRDSLFGGFPRYNGPQPAPAICPGCGFTSADTINLKINPEFRDLFDTVTIDTFDAGLGRIHSYKATVGTTDGKIEFSDDNQAAIRSEEIAQDNPAAATVTFSNQSFEGPLKPSVTEALIMRPSSN